jgi:mRNA turnover protein 4
MPKSKRAKIVHLSKTDKKGKELSEKLFANVREAAEKFQYIFVFAVENMRNTYLKEVRTQFADSRQVTQFTCDRRKQITGTGCEQSLMPTRLFFGKTKVMAKALGTTPAEEHLPNLSALSSHIAGNVGLLFTNRDPQTVIDHFASYSQTDFARAGVTATQTFTVPAGVVHSRGGELAEEDDVPLPHSLEVTVRKWGMPSRLVKGKVTLDAPYTVCKEGEVLNSHQTALLKLFGVAMADFRIALKAYYSVATEKVVEIDAMEE